VEHAHGGRPGHRDRERLLTGGGRYTDDVLPAGQAAAAFVRSPHGHAEIRAVRAEAARAVPGVLAVLTVGDLDAAGIGGLPCRAPGRHRDGTPMTLTPRPALARGRVRHVGDPVACVVAESVAAAREGAEAVEIDYAPLPAVSDPVRALAPGAPRLWEEVPGNLALDWEAGDGAAVDRVFAEPGVRVTTVDLVNNRLVANAMEPRGCLAEHDPADGRYTLRTGGQGVHSMQAVLTEMMGLPKEKVRVVQHDVGGGFGMKIWVYPEYPVCLLAARLTGRPVKWVAERGESFLSDTHGRDHVTRVQVAVGPDGRLRALRAAITANLGAYLSQFGPFIPTDAGAKMYNGVYALDAVHVTARLAYTNTVPVDAYRGAGRPEAAYAVERAVDAAAREHGLAPAEIRRRSFVRPEAMPYRTAMGTTYDSGEFERLMDEALERAEAATFPERRRAARAAGKLRGLGIAYYVEQCSGGPDESARVEVLPEGRVRVYIGTQSNGQGHATAYAQLLCDALGLEPAQVETVQGDTDLVATGRGTGGSRSVPVGGAAVRKAAEDAVEKGRRLAADMLEAAEADVEFADGRFRIVGTDRALDLFEVAAGAGAFDGAGSFQPPIHTFPNGCHVCEVEIDAATGVPEIARYAIVDDFGTVLNPLLVAGQVHGGVAQGIGQALLEEAVYDEAGQLLSGSLLDYAMPRALTMPDIDFAYVEVPCRTNPLGMKGAGEAGAIGAPPAVINAVVDALAELGVRHVDMPATAERLWRLVSNIKANAAA
jgi:aerobic carbon-monoxide dehydrogenase large subunit